MVWVNEGWASRARGLAARGFGAGVSSESVLQAYRQGSVPSTTIAIIFWFR